MQDALDVAGWHGHDPPMTPARFSEVLDQLGWSRRWLAAQLHAGTTTVDQWAMGKASVPEPVAQWLEALALVHARMPPPAPEAWNRRQGGGDGTD